jgi:hypothetical protein
MRLLIFPRAVANNLDVSHELNAIAQPFDYCIALLTIQPVPKWDAWQKRGLDHPNNNNSWRSIVFYPNISDVSNIEILLKKNNYNLIVPPITGSSYIYFDQETLFRLEMEDFLNRIIILT